MPNPKIYSLIHEVTKTVYTTTKIVDTTKNKVQSVM